MMKLIKIFALLLCVVPCTSHAYVNRDTATLRVMNKAAGKVQTIVAPVGKSIEFEKLTILVRSCKQTDPFQAEDYWAFIEVFKSTEGQIYGNWMSRNEPGDNPLQNADYDLWLVKCE